MLEHDINLNCKPVCPSLVVANPNILGEAGELVHLFQSVHSVHYLQIHVAQVKSLLDATSNLTVIILSNLSIPIMYSVFCVTLSC